MISPVKIGFVLLSNSQHPLPSTRIVVLNMFPFLRSANFEPHIVFEPAESTETPDVSGLGARLISEGFHIVIFQKVHGPAVAGLARQLAAAGIKTVYSVCDLVNVEMAEATDVTIVVTDYLKSLYPQELQSKIQVVHDGIEHPEIHKRNWRPDRGSTGNPLRAVLVTSSHLDRVPVIGTPPEWLEVVLVGRYTPWSRPLQRLRETRWKFLNQNGLKEKISYCRFLANRGIKCCSWDSSDVYNRMLQADIGIIPIETQPAHEPGRIPPMWKVKSENRLTMKMCIGLPVIATPIPAYEPVVEQGKNAFLAVTPEDWAQCLEKLRDPDLRATIGEQARASVMNRFSMEEQSRKLTEILTGLVTPSVH